MDGYVARKGNRWYAVIYEGLDPVTGRDIGDGTQPAPTRRPQRCSLVDSPANSEAPMTVAAG